MKSDFIGRAGGLCVALALYLLAACSQDPNPAPGDSSVVTIAQARQVNPPVLWPMPDGFAAAWVGSDDSGVHQDARLLTGEELGPAVALPLPPRHPFQQSSAPAGGENMHLLWLDEGEGEGNRLFSAVLNPALSVVRGPTAVSNRLTLHYALAPAGAGGLWIAWTGGLLAEPSLYVQFIDAEGRPREPNRIASNAAWPALAATDDGSLYVFWLDLSSNRLMRGRLVDGQPQDIASLTQGVRLEPGDRIDAVAAALDATTGYYVWNITRLESGHESWLASGMPDTSAWAPPRQLALPPSPADTGEGGLVPVQWAAPLPGQHDPLPILAQVEDRLVLLSLQRGDIASTRPVAALEAGLLAPPALYSGEILYGAWAEPGGEGFARLNVAALR